jgi:hypothetical protein
MKDLHKNLRGDLRKTLQKVGLTWATLEKQASEIILFGSRAARVATADSDWDLLCVGQGKSCHNNEIDIVWLSREEIESPQWLGSELASHVSMYGQWLSGNDTWSHRAVISSEAISRKYEFASALLWDLIRLWPHLATSYRQKHLHHCRKDVQRLKLLTQRRPVPPSQILDATWDWSELPAEHPHDLLAQAQLLFKSSTIRTNHREKLISISGISAPRRISV